ncbi:phage tail protein [Acuticoccus yangtzensis]|uniref:phage tail protein n=1 Tax=Acuticoccus yangtzensis TaxID=1443441 RepID=UPI0009496513
MPIPTFTPPVPPSEGSALNTQPKLLIAEFGDGYTQATADGLNHIKREFRATWSQVHALHADEIEAFFTARGGYEPFRWTLPDETTPRKWVCRRWDRQMHPNKRRTVSAEFVEDWSLAQ